MRLNNTAAPVIYRGVVSVVRRADGALAIGGPGEPVDWLSRIGASTAAA